MEEFEELEERSEPSKTGWIVLACLVAVSAWLLGTLVALCLYGYENTSRDEPWLLVLAATPVVASGVGYRFARTDWPDNPARLIAAAVVGLIVSLAALYVRVLAGGGM